MKKKGRIAGTIGLILSIILAGSTIVYGTMAHKNSEGRSWFGGDSTGNYFSDTWGKNKDQGLKKTLELVADTYAGIGGAKVSKYSSYTAEFTYTVSQKANDKTENIFYNTTVSSNAKYAHVTEVARYTGAREVEMQVSEYFLVKTGESKIYKRNNTTMATSDSDDEILDKATWSLVTEGNLTETMFGSFIEMFGGEMSAVEEKKVAHNKLTGEYSFTDADTVKSLKEAGFLADTIKVDYSFNVGKAPTLTYVVQGETKGRAKTVYMTASVNYSCLNATIVDLPKSLTKLVGKEA